MESHGCFVRVSRVLLGEYWSYSNLLERCKEEWKRGNLPIASHLLPARLDFSNSLLLLK